MTQHGKGKRARYFTCQAAATPGTATGARCGLEAPLARAFVGLWQMAMAMDGNGMMKICEEFPSQL